MQWSSYIHFINFPSIYSHPICLEFAHNNGEHDCYVKVKAYNIIAARYSSYIDNIAQLLLHYSSQIIQHPFTHIYESNYTLYITNCEHIMCLCFLLSINQIICIKIPLICTKGTQKYNLCTSMFYCTAQWQSKLLGTQLPTQHFVYTKIYTEGCLLVTNNHSIGTKNIKLAWSLTL